MSTMMGWKWLLEKKRSCVEVVIGSLVVVEVTKSKCMEVYGLCLGIQSAFPFGSELEYTPMVRTLVAEL